MGGDNFKPNVYSSQLWDIFRPGIYNIGSAWNAQTGQQGYGMPTAPTMPSMGGVLSGVSPYGISGYSLPNYSVTGYDIPNATGLMPTTDWWNSLSSDVKAGAWAPFQEGQNNLLETLGASGVSGSARGGYSGAAGAALGQYMGDASPAYAMNLWNMSQPGMMANWQAQLGQNQYLAGMQNQNALWNAENQLGLNQYLAGLQNQQSQSLWQNQLTERQTDYQNLLNQANQNYSGQMQAWQLPMQLAMNYNNLAPSGAYHGDSGGTLGSIMGAASSIALPIGMGMALGPSGAALGAGMSGMMGGKGSGIQPYNSLGSMSGSLFNQPFQY